MSYIGPAEVDAVALDEDIGGIATRRGGDPVTGKHLAGDRTAQIRQGCQGRAAVRWHGKVLHHSHLRDTQARQQLRR